MRAAIARLSLGPPDTGADGVDDSPCSAVVSCPAPRDSGGRKPSSRPAFLGARGTRPPRYRGRLGSYLRRGIVTTRRGSGAGIGVAQLTESRHLRQAGNIVSISR